MHPKDKKRTFRDLDSRYFLKYFEILRKFRPKFAFFKNSLRNFRKFPQNTCLLLLKKLQNLSLISYHLNFLSLRWTVIVSLRCVWSQTRRQPLRKALGPFPRPHGDLDAVGGREGPSRLPLRQPQKTQTHQIHGM